MGDPLPDYCEKCRRVWPCDDAEVLTSAIGTAPPIDMAAVREVIAELSAIISQGGRPVPSRSVVTAMRDKLEAAIQSILQGAGDEG